MALLDKRIDGHLLILEIVRADCGNALNRALQRELVDFTSVVLPGKSHLTAIAAPYIPKEYEESVVKFINANDPQK